MPATTKRYFVSGFICAILLAISSLVQAQNFTGQNVNIIVNFAAGGPTDAEARIIAMYLPKYLQGISSMVVRNVGGGGGNIGVNQLAEAAGRDRLSIGYFTWNPVSQIIHDETLHARYGDFRFVAGVRQSAVVYARRDTAPGIKKAADIAKAQLFRAAAFAPTNHGTVRQRLALDLLGAKYETIPGYKSVREMDLAIRQGDIQLAMGSLPGYFTSTKPLLVDTGIAMPLFQYDRPDGLPGRGPDLPDVQTFTEVYKDIYGKDAMPSGQKYQALQLLTRILDSMYRTVFMSPSAPQAAVDEMRSAFEKLGHDPEFMTQYEKMVWTKPRFVIGNEGERIIAELTNISPAMATFLRQYIGVAQ